MDDSTLSVVLVTCPAGNEAGSLATELINRRVCACVNIIPGIRSIFRWEGKVSDEKEDLMIIKTASSRVEELKRAILELHSYITPEFVVFTADSAAEGYLGWVMRETSISS
jgi:periplasmic divalent cation tolerance protein